MIFCLSLLYLSRFLSTPLELPLTQKVSIRVASNGHNGGTFALHLRTGRADRLLCLGPSFLHQTILPRPVFCTDRPFDDKAGQGGMVQGFAFGWFYS